MCGRFTLTVTPEALAEQFQLDTVPALPPRFNIAPSQAVAVVRIRPGRIERELAILQWGLVPSWAADPAIGSRLINARAESVTEKPAFRAAIRYRRCLVVSDGFYEWKGKGKTRQPYLFRLRSGKPFGLAGLWEHWQGADGSYIETCAILTTAANGLVRPVHDRMPVMVRPSDYGLWLDPKFQRPEGLEPLMQPYDGAEMISYAVSPAVNSPFKDDPSFVRPVEVEQEQLF